MSEVDAARRELEHAVERAVTKCGEHLLGEAQRNAPVEEGTLRASGDLEIHHAAGGRIIAEVSFSTAYAARQHEELDWDHPKGGEAKYLERALVENADRYTRIIDAEVARALR